jgi:hypothetical protein
MNRRTALMLSMFLGGLIPRGLWAQQARSKRASSPRDKALGPASPRGEDPDAGAVGDDPAAPFANEPGFQWKTYDIARYCQLDTKQTNPQKALVDWIFKRTGTADWHGDKVAVLSASRNQLRVYNSPEIIKQVTDIVERFVNARDDILSIHVQFIAAVDTRWRYAVFSRLTPVGSGAQGQQIWTMSLADAAHVLASMQMQQGFRKLADERYEMLNGQTLKFKRFDKRSFNGGMQRESVAGSGFQARAETLEEGITLKISPLLAYDGNAVDAMIDLTVNNVRSFHRTKVIAPREVGPSEMAIDVPEATETHLDQTVKNWPLGQTLLISAGVHPGVLDKKGGWFNLGIPGTYPTSTEVLIFLDAETVSRDKSEKDPEPVTRPASRSKTRKADPKPDEEDADRDPPRSKD